MFLTFVPKIPNPLSLSVKLHHYQKKKLDLSTIIIKVWPQLLVETKKNENYNKFVDIITMALQDLLVLTFQNCSKNYDCFNSLFSNQIKIRQP